MDLGSFAAILTDLGKKVGGEIPSFEAKEEGVAQVMDASESEVDNVHAPDNLDGSERNENIRHLKRIGIDVDQFIKDWDECSQTMQDKFEHYDSDFAASTKVDRWFGMIKECGTVSFGGHGEGKQADLFNVKYGDDCGCGREECECQKK